MSLWLSAKWAGWCVLAVGPAALNDNRSRAVDRIVGYQGLGLGFYILIFYYLIIILASFT